MQTAFFSFISFFFLFLQTRLDCSLFAKRSRARKPSCWLLTRLDVITLKIHHQSRRLRNEGSKIEQLTYLFGLYTFLRREYLCGLRLSYARTYYNHMGLKSVSYTLSEKKYHNYWTCCDFNTSIATLYHLTISSPWEPINQSFCFDSAIYFTLTF